jgi:adenine-specific DNA-methyltransferase
MLDKAELDFGIYRIMNQKRKDIEQFLDVDLMPQVQKILSESLSVDKQALQKELDDTIKAAKALGADPEILPKVIEMKKHLGETADMLGLENEVFSLLANFFKRYFDTGDFISMRRYKKNIYSIPYEGEEVKLHWANADQYYIKTSEYFKNYRFKLSNGKTIVFELIEANTEQSNNKSHGDKERRFAISEVKNFEIIEDEFKIYFTYEPTDKKIKQSELLDQAFDLIKTKIPDAFNELLSLRPTEKDKIRTLLQKHLIEYTARNTFDYFIHKDLGGFLSRELDFYIKNEVLFIDDLNTRNEQEFLKQLSKIKAIKKIGEKVIAFLAQLENFQKKLWLKKKMILECNYCITLDRVPKELYTEIIINNEQIQEWVKLFAIDEIKKVPNKDLFSSNFSSFSIPLTIEFLEQNPFLVLDTAFFSNDFKWKMVSKIENFDEQCTGLMINSDNFQALEFISNRFKESIDGTYIDPPYNTNATEIVYKNGFKDSSWMSLIYDRINSSSKLLKKEGILVATIDDYEVNNLSFILKSIFNEKELFTTVIEYNHRGRVKRNFAVTHEYGLWMINENDDKITRLKDISDDIRRNLRRTGTGSLRVESPSQFYGIEVNNDNFEIVNVTNALNTNEAIPLHQNPNTTMVFPVDDNNIERRWYYGRDRVIEESKIGTVWAKRIKGEMQIHYHQDGQEKRRKTVWVGPDLDGSTFGTELLTDILGANNFSFPKSIFAVKKCLESITWDKDAWFLDYFGGSGTTGHAVIKMNREDEGNRKFILVEMGEYFHTVTKPRIQKVIYSNEWKDGKPVARDGISQCFKYIRLESYEDTLNNLALSQSSIQQQALSMNPSFKEGYMLNYMLDVESQKSLLNLEWFVNPFNCYLNTTRNNEIQKTKVDLVETFNYLIGLVVESYSVPKDGYVIVTGKNLNGERILIVWRDCTIHSNSSLNKFLERSKYNPLDSEYDRIYVNGDNNVENLKTGDERWKVILIEEEFKNQMFEIL